jgi:O-antigen/teichoic acid export membrane protein
MLKKIISTYQSSLIIAVLSFTTVWLTVHYLGTIGRGQISLFLLNLSIVQIISSVVGSGSLVYLYSRHRLSNILLLTVGWAFICSVIAPIILLSIQMLPLQQLFSTVFLSFLTSILLNNYAILMARNQFFQYNLMRVLQAVLNILFFVAFFYIFKKPQVQQYILAMYLSYSAVVLLSFWLVFKKEPLMPLDNLPKTLTDFLKFGGLNQLSNIIQLGNYRATLYMLSKYIGLGATGIFSLTLTLTEAVWMFKDSIVTNHHSYVAKQSNAQEASKNNNKFMIMSGLGTLAVITIALLMPLSVYTKVFGADFEVVKTLLFLLSPGIIALAIGAVVSHYFSGVGKIKYNTYTSFAGLIVVLISGFYLIPIYGIKGAAVANALSYCTTAALLLVIYFGKIKKVNNSRG